MRKLNLFNAVLAVLAVVLFAGAAPVKAETVADPKSAPAARPKGATGLKNIEFEEGVVEGLGKRGKDSLSQVGDNDGRNRPRLYKKRLHFKEEMNEVYQEMEYSR